jgi:hypothetical protein
LAGQDLPVCGEAAVLAWTAAAAAGAFRLCNSGATNRRSARGTQSAFLPVVRVFKPTRTEGDMLWTIFVILLVLWLLGMVSSYTLGGFIHVLLIIAIAVVLIQLITGRRAV